MKKNARLVLASLCLLLMFPLPFATSVSAQETEGSSSTFDQLGRFSLLGYHDADLDESQTVSTLLEQDNQTQTETIDAIISDTLEQYVDLSLVVNPNYIEVVSVDGTTTAYHSRGTSRSEDVYVIGESMDTTNIYPYENEAAGDNGLSPDGFFVLDEERDVVFDVALVNPAANSVSVFIYNLGFAVIEESQRTPTEIDQAAYDFTAYEELMADPNPIAGTKHTFYGEVMQYIANDDIAFAMLIRNGDPNLVYQTYISPRPERDLVIGDTVDVYGVIMGYEAYETVTGEDNNAPVFIVDQLLVEGIDY